MEEKTDPLSTKSEQDEIKIENHRFYQRIVNDSRTDKIQQFIIGEAIKIEIMNNEQQNTIDSYLNQAINEVVDARINEMKSMLKKDLIEENKPFLTLTDVCSLTGLSSSTIYSYVSLGKISYYKPAGKQIYFKYDDVVKFIMNEKHYYKSKSALISDAETMYILGNK